MDGLPVVTALATFAEEQGFRGKGPLCVALVVTQHAKSQGLPLNAGQLVTAGGGQVLGLGKSAVQGVLGRHGIHRVLAAEGGRTSRGSLGNMREYVAFLNRLGSEVDLDIVESFWVERAKEFFEARPFRIKLDTSKGVHAVVRDLIDQAREREREAGGISHAGAVLQHLVGATLDNVLGQGKVTHNSFSTADSPTGRVGDFCEGDVVLHVTTSPSEALMGRCVENLADGYRPIVVTLGRGLVVAHELARRRTIEDRIDVLEIEQFIAVRVYELGGFTAGGRRSALADIVCRYNEIIEEFETDPSLKIRLR